MLLPSSAHLAVAPVSPPIEACAASPDSVEISRSAGVNQDSFATVTFERPGETLALRSRLRPVERGARLEGRVAHVFRSPPGVRWERAAHPVGCSYVYVKECRIEYAPLLRSVNTQRLESAGFQQYMCEHRADKRALRLAAIRSRGQVLN